MNVDRSSTGSSPTYEWDEAKRAANLRAHKVDFRTAVGFDWETAFTFIDDREDYGELREISIGYIGVGLHVLVFTRRDERIRIISLWKAQKQDVRRYVESTR
jgi:uncharacterized DUF497 family protein